jgi:hypothetical protein
MTICWPLSFEHKEEIIIFEKNMANANEYQKLLEPPSKLQKIYWRKIDKYDLHLVQ